MLRDSPRQRVVRRLAFAMGCVVWASTAVSLTEAPQPRPVSHAPSPANAPKGPPVSSELLDLTVKDIDGREVSLSQYKGRVVMIVNVASRCGLTPQYEALQRLYAERAGEGLVILGFPANNFGGQEPGSNSEIREFCTARYGVTFPMFSKISVAGPDQAELYRRLTALPAPLGGEIRWNFTKFVLGRDGKVMARFEPRTPPDAPEVRSLLDRLLKQPDPTAPSPPSPSPTPVAPTATPPGSAPTPPATP
jgi:glutathione peroxidase